MGDGRIAQSELAMWFALCIFLFRGPDLALMQQTIMEESEWKPIYMSLFSHPISFSKESYCKYRGHLSIFSSSNTKLL